MEASGWPSLRRIKKSGRALPDDACVDSVDWRGSESIRYKFWFRSFADGAAGDSPFTKEYFLFLLIFK